tara:strand:+ start:8642 stop:11491 length:2850 start_codon:yes stop_codon:yes gene_type:complete
MADSSFELYRPVFTVGTQKAENLEQKYLTQVLLPQISNNKNKALGDMFKDEHMYDKRANRSDIKVIPLNSAYGCDFESSLRYSRIKDRKDHIQFMQNIKPEQLAVMSPYVRFYVAEDDPQNRKDVYKNAVPISFDKSFDLNFLVNNTNNSSRGEGAGIKSVSVSRTYNKTAEFDPIYINASFFFSSYNVFINKPAIDRSSSFFAIKQLSNWISGVENLTYKELIRFPVGKKWRLLLEYGWSVSDGVSDDIISRKEKKIINKFEKVFYWIKPLEHTLDFSEDGSFTMNVKYTCAPYENLSDTTDFKNNLFNDERLTKLALDDTGDTVDVADPKRIKRLQKEIKDLIEIRDNPKTAKVFKKKAEKDRLVAQRKLNQAREFYPAAFISALRGRRQIYKLLQESTSLIPGISGPDEKVVSVSQITNPIPGGAATGKDKTIISRKEYSVKHFAKQLKAAATREKEKLPMWLNEDLNKNANKNISNILSKVFSTDAKSAGRTGKELFQNPKHPKAVYTKKVVHTSYITEPKTEYYKDGKKITNKKQIKQLNETWKDVYSPKNISCEFVLFRDVVSMIYEWSKIMIKDKSLVPTNMPYCILGNVAAPLPNGDKYWCNVGDIPITIKTLKSSMMNFFRTSPSGSVKDILHYMIQVVIPTIMTESNTRSSLPTISFPYFNFDSVGFKKQLSKTGDKALYNRLARGDKEAIEEFAEKFFDESKMQSSGGCIFIGQTASLQFENSKLFLSKNIDVFRRSYFTNDQDLLSSGVAKLIIGSASGPLINLNFGSNSDAAMRNLNHANAEAAAGGRPKTISSNFQYSLNATLFGNRIFEFTNLVLIPSYSIGASNPAIPNRTLTPAEQNRLRGQIETSDFEIGGLYTIDSVTDSLDLSAGSYRKSVSGKTLMRESKILIELLNDLKSSKKIVPTAEPQVDLAKYIYDNEEQILNMGGIDLYEID